MEKLGIIYDPVFLLHNPGPWHPESPKRLMAVREVIDSLEIPREEFHPRAATREELLLGHTPEYVDRLLNLDVTELMHLDPDTVLSPHSIEAAVRAVGGMLTAVDIIQTGEIKRIFAAVRPPGHHAEPGKAMGFCIFNNVAIGAAYALKNHGLKRIAIIDWDLHHGNGTQDFFYDTDEVLYISLHQSPYYPGTGAENESGNGKGLGYTLNLPMVPGSSDIDFRQAFDEVIMPTLSNYRPEIIFISAGFDAHRDDPLGSLYLTSEFYGEMTSYLVKASREFCDGKLISVLEGGYSLGALKESLAFHLKELCR
jgi:acetoin utilization deacetylase AcuC-like enzyme